MTVQKFDVAVGVSVNQSAKGTWHTLRELTNIAFDSEAANTFLKDVDEAVAPHYHKLATDIELWVRKEKGNELDTAGIAQETSDIFKSQLEDELKYLKSEKDWTESKLPVSAYAATQKILAALKYGGSLEKLTTVSQCEKYSREQAKAARKAKKEAFEQANGKAANDSAPALDNSQLFGGDSGLSEEHSKELASLMRSLAEAYTVNADFARTLVKATETKAKSIVANSLKAAAKKVVNG